MKKLPVIKYIVFFFLFAALGCDETTVEQMFPIGKESTFRVNQLYSSSDGLQSIVIKEISDSRCPEGVVCIWAGEVTIKGEWIENNNKSSFEIHSVLTDQQKQPAGYTIKVIDAKPYPKYGSNQKPEDLILTLLIQKN